jgi:hypothetical protein
MRDLQPSELDKTRASYMRGGTDAHDIIVRECALAGPSNYLHEATAANHS